MSRARSWREPPKPSEQKVAGSQGAYTSKDVANWRAEFGFAKRQHSVAFIGYTDDELLEWRNPFDALAQNDSIAFKAFEDFVKSRYGDIMDDAHLAEQVKFLWGKFDQDGSNSIDFGEFIAVGLAFDVAAAKEQIRTSSEGIAGIFERYAEDGYMADHNFLQLMVDFRFFVATATDVRKLVQVADEDRDGLVNLTDFVHWVESPFFELERKSKRRLVRSGRVPLPPPEPEDEEGELVAMPAISMGGSKRRGRPLPPPEPED